MSLVKITEAEYGVAIDLAYATANNFTGAPVYKKHDCYLHDVAAEHFRKAVKFAEAMGYKVKVFDAYRPTEAQEALWAHTPDPDFLAPPWSGSAHSRGVAIDLTLLDANGNELDMGTEFDAFTPLSFHSNIEVSADAQRNRRILLGIMTAAGWDFYDHEWWHYQLHNPRAYRLLSDKEMKLGMM
jgi:D-alanyl-D-alanine dipeptidase